MQVTRQVGLQDHRAIRNRLTGRHDRAYKSAGTESVSGSVSDGRAQCLTIGDVTIEFKKARRLQDSEKLHF
jgi:hypothetical protein